MHGTGVKCMFFPVSTTQFVNAPLPSKLQYRLFLGVKYHEIIVRCDYIQSQCKDANR